MLKNKILTKRQQITMLRNDDSQFSHTKKYFQPIIKNVLAHFKISKSTYQKLYKDLIYDVGIAGYNFLVHKRDICAKYQFLSYCMWYVEQRLKPYKKTIKNK